MINDWAGQGAEMNVNLNVSGTWICAYVSMVEVMVKLISMFEWVVP